MAATGCAAPPTPMQLECLRRNGIDVTGIKTREEASKLISNTPHTGVTIKQERVLCRHGFVNTKDWTFQQAHVVIALLKANDWEVPASIGDPAKYVPA